VSPADVVTPEEHLRRARTHSTGAAEVGDAEPRATWTMSSSMAA